MAVPVEPCVRHSFAGATAEGAADRGVRPGRWESATSRGPVCAQPRLTDIIIQVHTVKRTKYNTCGAS